MRQKIIVGAVAVLLASLGWKYRHSETVANWLHAQQAAVKPIQFDNDVHAPASGPAALVADAQSAATGTVTGLHKCRTRKGVIYTDEACPSGSSEQQIRGTVTVMPAQQPPASASASSSVSTVRDLLAPSSGPDLREKQMERVINQ